MIVGCGNAAQEASVQSSEATGGSAERSGGYDQAPGDGAEPSRAAPDPGEAGAGGAGGAVEGPEVAAESLFCGDGIRDPETEECDDGMGREPDLCTAKCQVSDALVERQVVESRWEARTRYLGEGRHPVAALEDGLGVVYVEPGTGDASSAAVGLSVFDSEGQPHARGLVSQGTFPVLFANPVLAALEDGTFAVAWTDFDGDGDELGIALRKVDPADPLAQPVRYPSQQVVFSQYDADLLLVGESVIAAWADDSDAQTGPDLRYRTLSPTSLAPTSDERDLADTAAYEGNVSLAAFGAGWAAAWRASYLDYATGDAVETVEVRDMTSNTRWSIGPHLGGAPEDHPALVELDQSRLLLLYTEGSDPELTGVANVPRLGWAVLDLAGPAEVEGTPLEPTAAGYAGDATIALSQPAAVRAGNRLFVSWRSAARPGQTDAENVWFAEVELVDNGGAYELQFTQGGELLLPRWPEGSEGDQRFGALSAAPYQSEHALAAAWDDYGWVFGEVEGQPDVVVQFAPLPLLRGPERLGVDCTVETPCPAGMGDCDSDDECLPWLVCGLGMGPNFGWAPDFGICVPPHCTNGVQDGGEEGVDCGGADCGTCLCGDGILLEIVGEECDTGGETAACDADCTFVVCGDGTVNAAAGEACDPGVSSNCLADCSGFEPGSVCLDGTSCLKVQHATADTPPTNQIDARLRLVNNGDAAAALSELTIRYWFTRDGHDLGGDLVMECDWAMVGCANVTRSLTDVSPIQEGADTYLEVGFTSSGVLQPGDETRANLRVHPNDWSAVDNGNDYSFALNTTYTDAPLITLYQNGTLIWGVEPGGSLSCGDGVVDIGESCDTEGESSACDADCTAVSCGDGMLNQSAGEFCDDGNQDDTDACPASCVPAYCGDGYVQAGVEACDPGASPDCLEDCSGVDPTIPCLRVQYREGDSGNATNVDIRPELSIVSDCGGEVPLEELELRYWYVRSPCPDSQACECYEASFGCEHVTRSFSEVSPARTGADHRLNVGFTPAAGSIPPGGETGPLVLHVHGTSWCTLNETDDYSYDPSQTTLADWERVTLYRNGLLIWGTPPDGPPSCDDGMQNGDESDVDCGGSCGPTCGPGDSCGSDSDCASGNCDGGVCQGPSCDDGILNGDETDIDCGGSCGPTCDTGQNCNVGSDCESLVCVSGGELSHVSTTSFVDNDASVSRSISIGGGADRMLVVAFAVEAGSGGGSVSSITFNGTPMHLGRSESVGWWTLLRSHLYYLGESELPPAGTYPLSISLNSASSGAYHVLELGGALDAPPEATSSSDDGGWGASSISTSLFSLTDNAWVVDVVGSGNPVSFTPTGAGQVERGEELGASSAAAVSTLPVANAGSASLGWTTSSSSNRLAQALAAFAPAPGEGGTCAAPTCTDGVANQDETDTDCGGMTCGPCQDGSSCNVGSDCTSNVCSGGICQQPSCSDQVQNQDETDIDCGGSICGPCLVGENCNVGGDCTSGVCTGGICQLPTCYDNVQNQDESDTDCGGSLCDPCPDYSTCNTGQDCTSGVCTGGICQPPTCYDNVQNQDETDTDCGGSTCGPCPDGSTCSVASDCTSGVCTGGICQVPTCYDNVQNQDESDTDCGGSVCDPCDDGSTCNTDADCESNYCPAGICEPLPAGCLKVQYRDADGGNVTNGDIRPAINIVNECDEPVAMSELELRYWYQRAPCTDLQVAQCYWSIVGCSNILPSFAAVTPARPGADYRLRIRFGSGAPTLQPGQSSGEVQLHVHGTNWCVLNETDDYSYDPTKTSFADWQRVTLYRNGNLEWGVEP